MSTPVTMRGSVSYLCPASELKEGMYIINPENGVRTFSRIIFIRPQFHSVFFTVGTQEKQLHEFHRDRFVEVRSDV